MAGLVKRGLLAKKRAAVTGRRPLSRPRRIPPDRFCAPIIAKHPGHLPEALLCAGNCAELGPILRGEKDAVQVLFSGTGAELLDQFYGDGLFTSHWLGGHRRRGAGGRAPSAGRSRPAHPRNRRRHRRPGRAGAAAARARPALLHVHRCLRGILPRRAAKAGRVPGGGVQDFRSRKTGHRAGARRGIVRLHHRHQRAARGQRCARRACAICTICSRRAAASSSWTRRRRSSGPRRSSA